MEVLSGIFVKGNCMEYSSLQLTLSLHTAGTLCTIWGHSVTCHPLEANWAEFWQAQKKLGQVGCHYFLPLQNAEILVSLFLYLFLQRPTAL